MSLSGRQLAMILTILALGPFLLLGAQPPAGSPQEPEDPARTKELVRSLYEAPSAAEAALRAELLRSGSPSARDRLFGVLRDPGISDEVFDGILIALEERSEQGKELVDLLVGLYAKGDPTSRRARRVLTFFQKLDRGKSGALALLSALRSGMGNGQRGALIEIAIEYVDTDAERRDFILGLIECLSDKKMETLRPQLESALRRVTFQSQPTPKDWDEWFRAFLKLHPEGFKERDLAAVAIAREGAEQRRIWSEACRRAIGLLGQAGVLPEEFLDASKYPEPAVRQIAVQTMPLAVGEDEKRAERAVDRLLPLVGDGRDPDPEVQRSAVEALGLLAKTVPKRRATISSAVQALINSGSEKPGLPMLVAAVATLRSCADESAAETLKLVYQGSQVDPTRAELRREVISAFAALRKDADFLAIALKDEDKNVRIAAANSLAVAGRPELAKNVAEAFEKEKDADVRQSLVACLVQIKNFTEPSALSVLEVAAKDPRLQREGLIGLLDAAGGEAAPPELRAEFEAELVATYPGLPKAMRADLVDHLVEQRSRLLVRMAVSWLASETEVELEAPLTAALRGVTDLDWPSTLDLARRVLDAGADDVAIEFADRVLAAPEKAAEGSVTVPPTPAERQAARRIKGRALSLSESPEKWKEAEQLLSAELVVEPGNFELRYARGCARVRLAMPKEAIEDFEVVYKAGPEVLPPDARAGLVKSLSRLYLEANQPEKAQRLLEESGAVIPKDRDYFILVSRAHLRLADAARAYSAATTALTLPGDVASDDEARTVLMRAQLRLPDGGQRERAASLMEDLDKTVLRAKLAEAREQIERDRELRNLVERLDRAATPEAVAEVQSRLKLAPLADVTVWLVHRLPFLVQAGAVDALDRRLSAVSFLYPEDPTLRVLAAQSPYLPPLSRAANLSLWWSARSSRPSASPRPL